MNKRQIHLKALFLCAAAWSVLADAAVLAPGGEGGGQAVPGKPDLGAMREWLSRRNVERKQLGLPGADLPKTHSAAVHPRLRPKHGTPPDKQPQDVAPENTAAQAPTGTPVLHLGRGPDGRIHVRYIVKEEGPDQMQVYSAGNYADPAAEAAKLDRLTARGKQVWLSGSSLRTPPAPRWIKKSLDPKIKD